MADNLSRRQFLQAAGGITFLSLVPIGLGEFAMADDKTGLPVFTALPYVQPGAGSKLVKGAEAMVIAWQTEETEANFELVYWIGKGKKDRVKISRETRLSKLGKRFNYAATIDRLPLGTKVNYRVTGNGQVVVEGFFTTRQSREQKIRFVALGDNCCKSEGNRHVAYQAYLKNPDFIVNVGDAVYDHGQDRQYAQHFFPVFNSTEASPSTGAPILRTVPYYSVLGNHDYLFLDPATNQATADFVNDSGALAYFTNMYLPENGPLLSPPPTRSEPDVMAAFKKCAGNRFPRMANYSFDYGPVHFTCLDSNLYVDPTNAELRKWIEADLKGTDAAWKFVIYHHPAFNVGGGHRKEQHMRSLVPLFESLGVDFVLAGHEHVYQRGKPLKFTPEDLSKAGTVPLADRRIPGKFQVDEKFNGRTVTKPEGIIHITTGAGGQKLYDPDLNNNPNGWVHKDDNFVQHVEKFISDRHSFSVFEVEGKELKLRQIDEFGAEIDEIVVTKA